MPQTDSEVAKEILVAWINNMPANLPAGHPGLSEDPQKLGEFLGRAYRALLKEVRDANGV